MNATKNVYALSVHTHTYIMSTDEYLCDPGEGKTLLSINENRESSTKSLERLGQKHHRVKAILGKSVVSSRLVWATGSQNLGWVDGSAGKDVCHQDSIMGH